jgi:hypothetical protein
MVVRSLTFARALYITTVSLHQPHASLFILSGFSLHPILLLKKYNFSSFFTANISSYWIKNDQSRPKFMKLPFLAMCQTKPHKILAHDLVSDWNPILSYSTENILDSRAFGLLSKSSLSESFCLVIHHRKSYHSIVWETLLPERQFSESSRNPLCAPDESHPQKTIVCTPNIFWKSFSLWHFSQNNWKKTESPVLKSSMTDDEPKLLLWSGQNHWIELDMHKSFTKVISQYFATGRFV